MNLQNINEAHGVVPALRRCEREIKTLTGETVSLLVQMPLNPSSKPLLRAAVCEIFGLTWERITARNNKMKEYDALHVFMFLAVKLLKCRTMETAAYCNRSNHTTTIYAVHKISGYYDIKDPLCDKIEAILILLKNKINENTY